MYVSQMDNNLYCTQELQWSVGLSMVIGNPNSACIIFNIQFRYINYEPKHHLSISQLVSNLYCN